MGLNPLKKDKAGERCRLAFQMGVREDLSEEAELGCGLTTGRS